MEKRWYTASIQDTLAGLKSSEHGLSPEEAIRRLKEYGQNKLPDAKVEGYSVIFLRQFKSPLIYILLVASAAIFIMGETVDAGIILFVLLFNALVGTIQEGKAQNTLLALKKFAETDATILRGGKEIIVPDKEVVVGDVLILQE